MFGMSHKVTMNQVYPHGIGHIGKWDIYPSSESNLSQSTDQCLTNNVMDFTSLVRSHWMVAPSVFNNNLCQMQTDIRVVDRKCHVYCLTKIS